MQFKHIVLMLSVAIVVTGLVLYSKLMRYRMTHVKKPYVVCTTTILASTIKAIAAESIELDILMKPGVDPRSYKPIESDMIKIAQADLIIYHGLHLEARMADLLHHLSQIQPTLAATKDIDIHALIKADGYEDVYDPHVWFSPKLWVVVVETITSHLSSRYPENAGLYEHNKKVLIDEMYQLYQTNLEQLQKIPSEQRILITTHDAFSYFAQAYYFKVHSLQGINTSSEITLSEIKRIAELITAHKIPTIFVESGVCDRSIQALSEQVARLGGLVTIGSELYADSVGPVGSKAATYLDMIRYDIDHIVLGLSASMLA